MPWSFITYGESVNQCEGRSEPDDGTDLSIGDHYVLKSPIPLRPIFQMTTITQYPRGPTTDNRRLCGVSSYYFAI